MGLGWSWRDPQARLQRQLERRLESARQAVLDMLVPQATSETFHTYWVNGRPTRSLVIEYPPAEIAVGWDGWLTSLLTIGGTIRLALTWRVYTPRGASWKLTMAESGHSATRLVRANWGWTRDRQSANAERDIDRVQQEMADGVSRLFAVSVLVTCEADTEVELETIWRALVGRLDRQLLAYRPVHLRHSLAFAQQTLGGARRIWLPWSWNTSTLAYSWPCVGGTVSMPSGPLWGVEHQTGRPILFDPFARDLGGPPAPHVAIIGPTGQGKSTAFGHVLSEYLTESSPPEVILIDPKGDYSALCAHLGGTRIEMAEEPTVTFNVMDLPTRTMGATGNPVKEQVRTVLGLVQLMVATDGQALNSEERSVVQKATMQAYARCGVRHDAPDTWDLPKSETPVLREIHREILDLGYQSLAMRLEPYTHGLYARLFSSPTTADLDNRLIVFDLQRLDAELRPIVVHLITAFTWRRARLRRRRSIYGMDEVKQLLAYRESAHLVGEVYALGRSFGLAAWSMSQLLEDYTATPDGERALKNADTVLLLKQRDDGALDEAARRWHLTPAQYDYLAGARVGDGVLCTNRGNVALHVTPTPQVIAWLHEAMAPPAVTGEASLLTSP